MYGACSPNRKMRHAYRIYVGKSKGDYFGNLNVDGIIILKFILEKQITKL
jgi:hypothetical protein